MIALGLSVVAFAFGRVKEPKFLLVHRLIMSSAVILVLIPVFTVMLPATLNFYTDTDVELLSSLSIMTVLHGVVGFPVVVLGLVFLSTDLPRVVRKWMRRTAILLVLEVGIGVLLFLQMLDLISFSMSH
jgi:hypothetical protein